MRIGQLFKVSGDDAFKRVIIGLVLEQLPSSNTPRQ
jgi:hypothetical protein